MGQGLAIDVWHKEATTLHLDHQNVHTCISLAGNHNVYWQSKAVLFIFNFYVASCIMWRVESDSQYGGRKERPEEVRCGIATAVELSQALAERHFEKARGC